MEVLYKIIFRHKTMLVSPFVATNVPCISEPKTNDVRPLKKHIASDFDRLWQ
jgi:hypothetical protein